MEEPRIRPHFTTAYCLWANRTIERSSRGVWRARRALLSEWKLPVLEWTAIVECLQSILCQSRLERMDNNDDGAYLTPIELFLGMKPALIMNPLYPFLPFDNIESLSKERATALIDISCLKQAMGEVHKEVAKQNEKSQIRAHAIHNARTNVIPENFTIGDYVMWPRRTSRSHKLEVSWYGPMRVTRSVGPQCLNSRTCRKSIRK